ncbi:MAG: hypothetical protein ACQ5SW_07750, partial [Sphaerochaetaceae bacterium]
MMVTAMFATASIWRANEQASAKVVMVYSLVVVPGLGIVYYDGSVFPLAITHQYERKGERSE